MTDTTVPVTQASDRITPALHEGGRFREWKSVDLAQQCLAQAREQLDPEFSQFMTAVAERLAAEQSLALDLEPHRQAALRNLEKAGLSEQSRASTPAVDRKVVSESEWARAKFALKSAYVVPDQLPAIEAEQVVAVAMFNDMRSRHGFRPITWDSMADADREEWLRDARTAIAAILALHPPVMWEVEAEKGRPFSEWHEDHGVVLWWKLPIAEAPYCGSPLDLGRTMTVTVQVGVEEHDLPPTNTGGWPFDQDDEADLWWTPLPMPTFAHAVRGTNPSRSEE